VADLLNASTEIISAPPENENSQICLDIFRLCTRNVREGDFSGRGDQSAPRVLVLDAENVAFQRRH
jgi:hypothetical protein